MSQDRELRILFDSFCNFGTRQLVVELDGSKFTKLCRDCHLLGGKTLTTTDVDIIFAKGMAPEGLKTLLLSSEGPVANGTKAQYNKFHDDKNLYTGMYRRRSHGGEERDNVQEGSSQILRFDKIFAKKPTRGDR
ncbi:hypothetical protein BSKO_01709 [Bryopsis sp. KO-2023]|nr:hypothetical protein BSKO_01709 [Bryopsis sp. KO-2023]